MADKLPSAILDSNNSLDSIFALELDTKQRFDNILSGMQTPIDYPIPDFQKEMYPNGLPQSDLLDPNIVRGTLGEGLFSPNPKIADYAVSKMRANQSRLPTAQGIGVPDRFAYDENMNKFLNGDFGYNPYQSIEDNEDFNYRYDYLNQGLAERIFKNVGTGVGRFLGAVALKLGQTVGFMGSMVGNGIQEIFDPRGNNFMADVADNSLSRWFEQQEQDMKDSNLLSVFKPRNWDEKGFFSKLGNGAFWTDEVADGAAFMGEMVASMYLLGGLGKVAPLARLGQTELNLASKLGGFGRILDKGLKFATGADDLSGIGRWAFSTTSESAFEASAMYKTRKSDLEAQRAAGKNNYTDDEIQTIAGDEAAASFKANMLILSASNAFENRFIFNPLFKKLGFDPTQQKGSLISVSGATNEIDDIAKASRRQYKYATQVGKYLDLKNPNSRLRFYGGRSLSAVAAEGFWEENAQLAVERLAADDNLSFSTFVEKIGAQAWSALKGEDPEAAQNIGLGGLIGAGAVAAVTKARGGDKLFRGERRQREIDTQLVIDEYEGNRKAFLNYQDIYTRDPSTGKPIMDSEGNLQIDEVAALGLLDGTNKLASQQGAIAKVTDPLLKKNLQDNAMISYVMAAKNAGIFKRSLAKFKNLENLDAEQLQNLGFDPTSIVDAPYLKASMEDMGKIYDKVFDSRDARRGKEDTPRTERSRKFALFTSLAREYSAKKIASDYQAAMMDVTYPSVFSPEAADQDTLLQEYNSTIYQRAGHNQWAVIAKDNGDFYNEYIDKNNNDIDKSLSEQLRVLLPKVVSGELIPVEGGFLMSPARFQKLFGKEFKPRNFSSEEIEAIMNLIIDPRTGIQDNNSQLGFATVAKQGNIYPLLNELISEEYIKRQMGNEANRRQGLILLDMEQAAQAKYGQMKNVGNQQNWLSTKLANLETGIRFYHDLMSYGESIQKKDSEAGDSEQNPPAPEAPTPVTPSPTPTPTATPESVQTRTETEAPIQEATEKEILQSQSLLQRLDVLFTGGLTKDEDIALLIDFLDNNWEANSKEIITYLRDTLQEKYIEPAINRLNNATLTLSSLEMQRYAWASDLINSVASSGISEEMADSLIGIMRESDDLIENYDFPEEADSEDFIEPPLPLPDDTEPIDEVKSIPSELINPTGETVITPTPVPTEPTLFDELIEGEFPNDELRSGLRAGDTVVVNTKKDGQSIIREILGDKAILEDGRRVALKNLTKAGGGEPVEEISEPQPVVDESLPPITELTQADETRVNNSENITPPAPPTPEPPQPIVVENSDSEGEDSNNYLDNLVDEAKKNGIFTFVMQPSAEIVTDKKGTPQIENGAIQLKTTQGDQQKQLLRQHNTLKRMSLRNEAVNFWSEDPQGNKLFRVKLISGDPALHSEWIYDPAKGLKNAKGESYPFPMTIAVITDQAGNPVYFDQQGSVSDKVGGMPVAFPFSVTEYTVANMNLSRRGIQTGSNEPLNGAPAYASSNPLGDLNKAVRSGVPVFAEIDEVTSGKLSSYNVTNSPRVEMRPEYKLRTVAQMRADGDIASTAPFVFRSGEYFEYSTDARGRQVQQVKVGQPFLFDNKSGLYIPLRGKLIRDLTLNGQPLIQGDILSTIQGLQNEGVIEIDENSSSEEVANFDTLYDFLRGIFYSQTVSITRSKDGTKIYYNQNEDIPNPKPLLDTEVNYTSNISVVQRPFSTEQYSYDSFVAENFQSGAVPAEVEKGKKTFEKLNKRIIFTLDKTHQELVDAAYGAQTNRPTQRVSPENMSKFQGKVYKRSNSDRTMTVTSASGGQVVTRDDTGKETIQSNEDFMKTLTNMQEVNLPAATEEINQEFVEKQKLSKDEVKELLEKSKNMTEEDLSNLNFDC